MRVTVLIENTAPTGLACEHGLSLHIEHGGRRWLLDAGASPRLVENAAALEVDLGAVDAAVLSHGHFDHAGGFSAFFARNAAAPLYLRPQALEPGYVRTRGSWPGTPCGCASWAGLWRPPPACGCCPTTPPAWPGGGGPCPCTGRPPPGQWTTT